MSAPGEYNAWISDYAERNRGIIHGRCKDACTEMAERFPELTIVTGHIEDASWGRRGHFWLVTRDGAIVDPTRAQFPCLMSYETGVEAGRQDRDRQVHVGAASLIWLEANSLEEPPTHPLICSEACFKTIKADLEAGGDVGMSRLLDEVEEGVEA